MKLKLGKILLLSGTSSAGKSSIAKKLHEHFSPWSIIMSIDDFMRAETTQKAQELGCAIGIGAFKSWWIDLQVIVAHLPVDNRDTYFQSCLLMFYQKIKEHVLAGKLVIVDMVLEFANDFYEVLGKLPMIKVLIYTPLPKLLKNLEQRNLSGDFYHRRVFTSTMRQFFALYRPLYEGLEADEEVVDVIDVAQFEMACDYLKKEAYWSEEKAKRFCHLFIYVFTKDTHEKIAITPILDYDCIINTTTLSLSERIEFLASLIGRLGV